MLKPNFKWLYTVTYAYHHYLVHVQWRDTQVFFIRGHRIIYFAILLYLILRELWKGFILCDALLLVRKSTSNALISRGATLCMQLLLLPQLSRDEAFLCERRFPVSIPIHVIPEDTKMLPDASSGETMFNKKTQTLLKDICWLKIVQAHLKECVDEKQ